MKRKAPAVVIKLWKSSLVKFIVYLIALLFVLILSAIVNGSSEKNIFERIIEIILKEETMSFLTAGLFTLLVAYTVKTIGIRSEENLKIESDHHKIITKYNGYINDAITSKDNFYDKKGRFMRIHHIRKYERDVLKKYVKASDKEVDRYVDNGVLSLPTINLYTNQLGNTQISIIDKNEQLELPNFVTNNAMKLLSAHQYSKINNNTTIRLDDISMKDNILNLSTSRTTYFNMLLTNRCMDYKIDEKLSLREVFEYDKTVTSLECSKLSNQIGINGMILTSDGYLLIEKRDRKKTTWKNKFAQPISLALKESDLELDDSKLMKNDTNYANDKLLNIIRKTIKSNFGLTINDYQTLSIEENFLGLARDLLEGGKPNMYFFVTLNYNAKELLAKLKYNASKVGKDALKKEKLNSEYYLIPYNEIRIDYDYILSVSKKDIFRVERIVYPRCKKSNVFFDKLKYKISKLFNKNLTRECGEALLVTLSYLEICQSRIKAISDKRGITDEK